MDLCHGSCLFSGKRATVSFQSFALLFWHVEKPAKQVGMRYKLTTLLGKPSDNVLDKILCGLGWLFRGTSGCSMRIRASLRFETSDVCGACPLHDMCSQQP